MDHSSLTRIRLKSSPAERYNSVNLQRTVSSDQRQQLRRDLSDAQLGTVKLTGFHAALSNGGMGSNIQAK